MDNKKVRVKIVSITLEPQVIFKKVFISIIRKLCSGEGEKENMILCLDFWQSSSHQEFNLFDPFSSFV